MKNYRNEKKKNNKGVGGGIWINREREVLNRLLWQTLKYQIIDTTLAPDSIRAAHTSIWPFSAAYVKAVSFVAVVASTYK